MELIVFVYVWSILKVIKFVIIFLLNLLALIALIFCRRLSGTASTAFAHFRLKHWGCIFKIIKTFLFIFFLLLRGFFVFVTILKSPCPISSFLFFVFIFLICFDLFLLIVPVNFLVLCFIFHRWWLFLRWYFCWTLRLFFFVLFLLCILETPGPITTLIFIFFILIYILIFLFA